MNSLLYLKKRTFVNKLKKALRRPVTYIAAAGILGYAVMILWSFGMIAEDFGLDNPASFATVLSILVFLVMPADIISYTKRKGLVFQSSEVHFVFPSPENPKKVLLMASIRNYIIMVLFGLFFTVFGIVMIGVEVWRMLLYFIFFAVLENVLEGSMIIICYGNQTLPKTFFKVLSIVLYALMGVLVAVGFALLYFRGFEFGIINEYLTMPIVQAIPVIGWAIAFIHLLLVGPTTVNIICTICYVATVVVLFICACKMKCTGEYYEDAMSFAEEFEIRRKKAQKGEVTIGRNKKLKTAHVEYKGTYAKAIFYRQLLEYKKNRFFIFGFNSLLFFAVGVGIAFLSTTDMMEEFRAGKPFIIPAIMAYIVLIFSGYLAKWSKELENPYTYLIPDNGIRKLWYATKIEHIRALVDGCLMTIPAAIALKLNPLTAVLTILLYICLNANKLYLNILSEALLGNVLGNTGKTLLRSLFQGLVMLAAIIMAAVCGILIGVNAGFAGMIIMTVALTIGIAVGAATAFDKMERWD